MLSAGNQSMELELNVPGLWQLSMDNLFWNLELDTKPRVLLLSLQPSQICLEILNMVKDLDSMQVQMQMITL